MSASETRNCQLDSLPLPNRRPRLRWSMAATCAGLRGAARMRRAEACPLFPIDASAHQRHLGLTNAAGRGDPGASSPDVASLP